mmetsp:Transcript_7901/g.11284  ORF Transcript_7901/g.11284 Transcript_7901/m.11284 type:complete len:122 (+) Transcript_7901:38-403(+)
MRNFNRSVSAGRVGIIKRERGSSQQQPRDFRQRCVSSGRMGFGRNENSMRITTQFESNQPSTMMFRGDFKVKKPIPGILPPQPRLSSSCKFILSATFYFPMYRCETTYKNNDFFFMAHNFS